MSGELTNIRPAKTDGSGLYTQTDKIYYYDISGNQKSVSYVYYAKDNTSDGLSLIWQRDHSDTTNLFASEDGLIIAEYIPTSDIIVTSVSMILNDSTTWNGVFDIYDINKNNILNSTSSTTIETVSLDTAKGTVSAYKHTATYSTGITLTAGNTYYIIVNHVFTNSTIGVYYYTNKIGNYLLLDSNYAYMLKQTNSLTSDIYVAYIDKKFYMMINGIEV